MIRMLHQVLREVIQWQGHEEVAVRKQRQEDGEPCSNKDVQCYKCRGFGHFKRECPMAKRRRFKGFRWRKIGHDEASTSSESDSESEEEKYDEGLDDGLRECYKQVCGTLVKLGKENMVLVKEQRRLEALIEVLQKDLQVEKEKTRQARVKPYETQKGKTETVSMSAMKPVVKKYARTTSYGKTAVKTATATRTASSSTTRKISECTNMKARQEVLKHGCVAGTRKETDRCISSCVRPSKKQHQMCCWFCGKVGHKKVECFAREKSRNMAKKVNKTFTKPKRVEKVSLPKSGLLDEIKEETSEEGCSSGRSDLESALGVDEEGLMVKETTHEGNQVLNRSGSRGSSTCASDRDALSMQSSRGRNGDVSGPRSAYLMVEKSMVMDILKGRLKMQDVCPEVVVEVVADADDMLNGEDHVESRC
ncbi:hypothetical protein F2Q69_00015431 [Brassica cretica]|uniref:CCHC-type domain-containing protein n=1 Tax=Brassica cretica TaxID=69181 RepID=A0A8S9QRN8_BRACR|nr:hypothetical protein F2Q69_00015431 [Brassica cretica]